MDDWRKMTAAALGDGIGRGEIDAVALTEAFLEAAGAEGGRIYARLTRERALAEAEAAAGRAKAGVRRSRLDGVPVSWKDLFDTAGVATEGGSALLKGRVPEADAAVVARTSAAGLVMLGKTHMSELAFSGLGLNPVTATPPNVNDAGAVPGGSSSGAAASVAFGLAAGAYGSDTAGSVRVPSAWNDLVGYRPSIGLFPEEGTLPLCPSYDTPGPLARSVEDCVLMQEAMGGPSVDLRGADLKGRRIVVAEGLAMEALDPAVAEGFAAAVGRLEAAGAEIVRRRLPEAEAALEMAAVLFAPEAYGVWREAIEAAPEVMYHPILTRFRGGAGVLAADFVAAQRRLAALRRAHAEAVADADAVALPTAAILPPQRARLEADDGYYTEANLATLRNARMGSLLDLPGVSLPTGVPSTGLLLNGLAGRDAALLRLAAAAERALTEKPQ